MLFVRFFLLIFVTLLENLFRIPLVPLDDDFFLRYTPFVYLHKSCTVWCAPASVQSHAHNRALRSDGVRPSMLLDAWSVPFALHPPSLPGAQNTPTGNPDGEG